MQSLKAELCLDFSNTVDSRNSKKRKDNLDSFDSLVKWSVKEGLLGRSEAERLTKYSNNRHLDATTLRRALDFREAIYRIFSALTHSRRPTEEDIATLNAVLSTTSVSTKLVRKGEDFAWEWEVDPSPQSLLLWPVAKSAADLLTSEKLDRIRECANEVEGCGWLFMDRTRSRTKRYCSSEGCGNRAKVRAWYERNEKAK